jgi:PIN domain nuclease of toxin-antitoxin system
MRLLLDTRVALWWLNDPDRLEAPARDAIADGYNTVFVSAASVWEAAVKASVGRLIVPEPLPTALEAAGVSELPIRARHAVRAGALPPLHRDPFDRMLVAQAVEEGLTIVTRDPLVRRYGVPTLAG